MGEMQSVLFTPYSNTHTKVTAKFSDDSAKVVYLDNRSAKQFLQTALLNGSVSPPVWGQ